MNFLGQHFAFANYFVLINNTFILVILTLDCKILKPNIGRYYKITEVNSRSRKSNPDVTLYRGSNVRKLCLMHNNVIM